MVNFGSCSNWEQHPYILMSHWGYPRKSFLHNELNCLQFEVFEAIYGGGCPAVCVDVLLDWIPARWLHPTAEWVFCRIVLEGKPATEVRSNTSDDGRMEQTKFLQSTVLQVAESNLQMLEKCQGKERQQGPSSSESICEKLLSPDGWNGFHIHCTCSLVLAISSAVVLLIYGSYFSLSAWACFPFT